MAGRVPATCPRSVGPPRRLYNCRCVGGRDTPGHDDLGKILVPQPLILMPMATADHNDMAPPVRQGLRRLVSHDAAKPPYRPRTLYQGCATPGVFTRSV